MNTRTENLKRYNFAVGGDQYAKNYEEIKKNFKKEEKKGLKLVESSDAIERYVSDPTETLKEQQAEAAKWTITNCNRCHIKINTNNGKCPCCNEPVEI